MMALRTRNALVALALSLVASGALLAVPLLAWGDVGDLTVGSAGEFGVQAEPVDYWFEQDSLVVEGVASGSVAYNETTKTLTLNGVSMKRIEISEGCPDFTVKLVGDNTASSYFIYDTGFTDKFYYDGADADVSVTVTGKGSMDGCVRCSGDFTISGGTLTASDAADYGIAAGVVCLGDFTMAGGKLKASAISKRKADAGEAYGVVCHGNMYMKDGAISAKADSKVGPAGIWCYKNLNMSGGKIDATAKNGYAIGVQCSRDIVMLGGKISVSGITTTHEGEEAVSCKKLLVKGGTISVSNCPTRGIYCEGLTLNKGSIIVKNLKKADYDNANIHVYQGNFKMTGGTLKISSDKAIGVWADSGDPTFNEKAKGGKIAITGGSLAIKIREHADGAAFCADKATCKVSLKNVKGGLIATGFTFKAGGNVYKTISRTTSYNSSHGYPGRVILANYNGKSKRPALYKAKFNGRSYAVTGIGSKAFATKSGAKVTSVTLYGNSYVNEGATSIQPNAFKGAKRLSEIYIKGDFEIQKNAFAGTKALTYLEFQPTHHGPGERFEPGDDLNYYNWLSYDNVSKKAFANCGKGGGAGLVVAFAGVDYAQSGTSAFRKLLTSKGMPKSFTLQSA